MKWRNLGLIFLQVLFLLFIVYSHYSVILTGEEIILKSRPVDPYDIFRGAYVTLGYEEEDIPVSKLTIKELAEGDPLYVTFKKRGDIHVVDQVFLTPPKQGVYLPATYLYTYFGSHRVSYQLDRYYTNENEALELEQMQDRLLVHIKVKSGRGIIDGITILAK